MSDAHILLIEPNISLANTYTKAFRHQGYSVRTACTAQDALDAAEASRPDLVVLELQLVGHDGIEFLQEFRSYAEWQTVPIIILSHVVRGDFLVEQAVLRRDFGVVCCLPKARINLTQLLRKVREALPA